MPSDADRAALLERVAAGLAHEGKNPLHNMVLHLQLMAEKLSAAERAPIDRHLQSLRDGIAKVDSLLRAFGEFANPDHLPTDLGAAVARTLQLFQYDARRAAVQVTSVSPGSVVVRSSSAALSDLVAHVYVAAIELARDGGNVEVRLDSAPPRASLEVIASGGNGKRETAQPHLDAARRLAIEAACDLSIETPSAGGARLSLSFAHPG